jgi:hypothetical protein
MRTSAERLRKIDQINRNIDQIKRSPARTPVANQAAQQQIARLEKAKNRILEKEFSKRGLGKIF